MSTKERLLETAIHLFAEQGYRDTTIADICSLAKANIASVNYHFGGKDSLYVEAWKTAFHQAIKKYPPDGGIAADAPVEARFHGRITAAIRRITDPECLEFSIIAKEMANPTHLLQDAVEEVVDPFRQAMIDTISEMLGPNCPKEKAQLCCMSVMSQCLHLMMNRRGHAFKPLNRPAMPAPDALADHIVEFSLGAIRDIRRSYESQS